MPIKLQDCNLEVVGSSPTRSMAMSRSGSSMVEHAVLSLLSPPLKIIPPLGMPAALHWQTLSVLCGKLPGSNPGLSRTAWHGGVVNICPGGGFDAGTIERNLSLNLVLSLSYG